jgi:Prohead core protein serine protease
MSKQVLIEYLPFTPLPKQLNEARMNPKAPLIVAGLVQAADKPNANRRIYDFETLAKQVQLYIDGPIKERRALGELDHPESSVINLKNVCHNITRLWWDGKNLMGEFEILDTPSGNILKELFLNNITVGVSSRAMGSVTPIGEGLVQVEDDLELICWDFVSTPSTYGAYVKPVGGLNESYNPQSFDQKQSTVNRLISDIICTQSGVCCIK